MLLLPNPPSRETGHAAESDIAAGDIAGPVDRAPQMHYRVSHAGPWIQFRSPRDFQWNHADLEIPSLPPALAGLRIVHLTDFHLRGYWTEAYDHLIERVNRSDVDLLLLTGDFVEDKHDHRPALPFVQRLLTALRARHGVYAILGNHDGDLFGPHLARWNITLLNDRCLRLDARGGSIELVGLPGPLRVDMSEEFVRRIPSRQPGVARIALSHFPDHLLRIGPLRPDIVLCGHTHGGQVCLPGGIPLITHDSLPRRYCKGIHRIQNTWLVVNRGFGFSSFLPLRLFCPAEVIELRLVPMGSIEQTESGTAD